MMDELTRFLEDHSKEYLEVSLRHHRAFTPSVLAFRGDQQIAAVMCAENSESDEIMAIATLAAGGWAADILAVTFDSFISLLPENPGTGRPWQAGEMSMLAAKHKARERGWVTDALCIHILNRAGDWRMVNLPYSVAKKSVKWGEPDRFESTTDNDEIRGRMADMFITAMKVPPVEVDLGVNEFKGLPYDDMRIVLDCMTAGIVSRAGGMVALVGPADPHSTRLMASFMHSMGINADITPPIFMEN